MVHVRLLLRFVDVGQTSGHVEKKRIHQRHVVVRTGHGGIHAEMVLDTWQDADVARFQEILNFGLFWFLRNN